jgi:EmrB/QacA subfamily drug resistance transporter
MGLAIFLISNDITSLGVALPEVEKDFNVDVTTVQWVLNAYTLAFGVLIVTGGRLSDLLGRRRMFFTGAGIFAGFSLVAALAPDAQVLIGARAAMAVGAALIWPAVVGLTFSLVPAARIGIAGGLLLGVSGVGNALGPIVGGFLTDEVSWRAILVLNIPIALLAIFAVLRSVDADAKSEDRDGLDWFGIAALSVGMVALLVALDQSSSWGWSDPRVLGLLAIALLSLAALVPLERRAGTKALIPSDVMGKVPFAAACLTTLLASGTWFAVLLFVPQFMEKALGFSAFEAGVGFLPLMVVFSLASFGAGPLYNRIGAKLPLLTGTVLIPVGALLLSLPGADSGYLALVPAFVVLGVGVGLFYSTLTTAALTSIDPSRTSVGSGLTFMFQLVGGALGVGLATAVFGSNNGAEDIVAGVHGALRIVALLAVLAIPVVWFVVRDGRNDQKPG